jgi:hypothetical protein
MDEEVGDHMIIIHVETLHGVQHSSTRCKELVGWVL